MRDWKKYLADEDFKWKDMFILLIDGGYMDTMVKDMIEVAALEELSSDELEDFIKHLENKIRMA